MSKSIAFILFSFFYFLGYGQYQEYIVTKNNDTIYGKVIRSTSMFNPSKVNFKIKDKDGKKITIKPSEVKTIRSFKGVDGDCIITTIYDEWFIKEIISGRIKLYQLVDGVLFFVSKDSSEIRSTDIGWFFSSKKAHEQVRLLLKDKPIILREFDSLQGTESNIKYIIEKYNKSQF